jgi:hypothetical protein
LNLEVAISIPDSFSRISGASFIIWVSIFTGSPLLDFYSVYSYIKRLTSSLEQPISLRFPRTRLLRFLWHRLSAPSRGASNICRNLCTPSVRAASPPFPSPAPESIFFFFLLRRPVIKRSLIHLIRQYLKIGFSPAEIPSTFKVSPVS